MQTITYAFRTLIVEKESIVENPIKYLFRNNFNIERLKMSVLPYVCKHEHMAHRCKMCKIIQLYHFQSVLSKDIIRYIIKLMIVIEPTGRLLKVDYDQYNRIRVFFSEDVNVVIMKGSWYLILMEVMKRILALFWDLICFIIDHPIPMNGQVVLLLIAYSLVWTIIHPYVIASQNQNQNI